MASHSLMSPVLLNLCGTIERESGRVGQPQHNDNTVPGSHGMGSILDWCWFHVRSIFDWFPLDFRSVLVCCSLVLAWFSFDVRSILRGRGRGRSSFRIPWFTSMFRCSNLLCCMLVLSLLLCYIAFHLHPIFCVFAFYRYPHLLDEYDDIFVRSFFNVTPLSLYILNEYE